MGEGWGVLAAVLSSGLGGTSIGATRYLVDAIDPLAIGSFRFGIGFVLLLPVAMLQGARWPARRDWPAVAALGMLFFAAFPLLFNASLISTTAARGALALSTLPLLTMLVGAVLGSEALTARKSLGVVIAMFGVAIALLTTVPTYLIYYVVQPMPAATVIKQVVFGSALMVVLGIVAAFMYRERAVTAPAAA